MDSLIKQTRRKRPISHEKVPPRKSVSFKEDKKKTSNWLQKQFSRQMSGESYDSISDMDHAAAVAATAYAITTFEETWLESFHSGHEHGASLSRSKSRKEVVLPEDEPRSLSRRFSGQLSFKESEKDHKLPKPKSPSVKKTPSFAMNLREDSWEKHERQRKQVSDEPMRIQPPHRTRSERRAPPPPPPPPPPSPPPMRLPPMEVDRTSRKSDYTADAWEKAELAKIKAKYEKLNRKIDLWEAKKRDKARKKLDKSEQSEQEERRRRGLQKFREDTEYIEQIARGARAQAEKQRQSQEMKVKEKASIVRRTGKLPGKACLCF